MASTFPVADNCGHCWPRNCGTCARVSRTGFCRTGFRAGGRDKGDNRQFCHTQSPTINGGTSVWNFTPQGGLGLHYFTRPKRSIDLGVNAVHISSASLGDRNPGVNASIQVQVGYTFWT